MDNLGVIHIATSSFDWDVDEGTAYTRSEDFGATWSAPTKVLDPSSTEQGYWLTGGVAAMDGHVCVGGCGSDGGTGHEEPDFCVNVSHDNGLTWETQTLYAGILESGWEEFTGGEGSGIWLDESYVYFTVSGYFYASPAPSPYDNAISKRHNQFIKASYRESGSLSITDEGITYPEMEGGTIRRYNSALGGNVAYNQSNAGLLSVVDLVPVHGTTWERETPYGYHFWYLPLRRHTFTVNGIEPEDIWLSDVFYGPDDSNTWTGEDEWTLRILNDNGLRISSWRGAFSGSLYGPRAWMM